MVLCLVIFVKIAMELNVAMHASIMKSLSAMNCVSFNPDSFFFWLLSTEWLSTSCVFKLGPLAGANLLY